MFKSKADELITALENNDYTQITKQLRDKKGFCVLGIICDISKLGRWHYLEVEQKYAYIIPNSKTNVRTGQLPREVMNLFGMRTPTGIILLKDRKDKNRSLAYLNDKGATLKEIANFLRLNYSVI